MNDVQKEQPDYTSRVPHYTFAETLEEQEAQLATNPLLPVSYTHLTLPTTPYV